MREKARIPVTWEQMERARREGKENPISVALRESELILQATVRRHKTIERDSEGKRKRTYWHSQPLTRWINRWGRGEEVEPMEINIDPKGGRMNIQQEGDNRHGKDSKRKGEKHRAIAS